MDENDSYLDHSDRHYTNGLYWSQTSPAATREEAPYASTADDVMLDSGPGDKYRHGYFVGQSMFTPQFIGAVRPNPFDRPYAGWLFGGFRLYRESGDILDRAEVTAGIVGPLSGAENVQKSWHALWGFTHPNGWGSQLANEPGLVVSEQRIWRIWRKQPETGLEFEALPEVTASAGNIFDYAGVGGMLRLGQNLKADWGPPRIQPALSGADFVDETVYQEQGFAWYLFAGGEERLMLHNIFLDGNTFQSSASVQAKQYVGDFSAGIALLFQGVHVNVSYTQRTHEFVTQRGNDEFLSINLSFR